MKAALVTGGSKRIGREISLALAKTGYSVAVHYNTTEPDELLADIRALGLEAAAFRCDLSDAAGTGSLIARVIERFAALELLVNNASIFERAPITETDVDLLERQFAVNFRAPYILSRDYARLCGRGSIINIVDTKTAGNGRNYSAYTLSKKALAEFTRTAAVEFAPGIRVNAVAPGLILPPAGEDDSYMDRMAEGVPLRRKGSPAEVAAAVTFLAENSYITGQTIFVDGGENLR